MSTVHVHSKFRIDSWHLCTACVGERRTASSGARGAQSPEREIISGFGTPDARRLPSCLLPAMIHVTIVIRIGAQQQIGAMFKHFKHRSPWMNLSPAKSRSTCTGTRTIASSQRQQPASRCQVPGACACSGLLAAGPCSFFNSKNVWMAYKNEHHAA